jgi:hypothetical protein
LRDDGPWPLFAQNLLDLLPAGELIDQLVQSGENIDAMSSSEKPAARPNAISAS